MTALIEACHPHHPPHPPGHATTVTPPRPGLCAAGVQDSKVENFQATENVKITENFQDVTDAENAARTGGNCAGSNGWCADGWPLPHPHN